MVNLFSNMTQNSGVKEKFKTSGKWA